jgi:hypothetical protein
VAQDANPRYAATFAQGGVTLISSLGTFCVGVDATMVQADSRGAVDIMACLAMLGFFAKVSTWGAMRACLGGGVKNTSFLFLVELIISALVGVN